MVQNVGATDSQVRTVVDTLVGFGSLAVLQGPLSPPTVAPTGAGSRRNTGARHGEDRDLPDILGARCRPLLATFHPDAETV